VKWLDKLKLHRPDLAKRAERLNREDGYVMYNVLKEQGLVSSRKKRKKEEKNNSSDENDAKKRKIM
jgi:hypothetical protein